jgi:exopolyphosphatase/pppGpp-phosphohydrolase
MDFIGAKDYILERLYNELDKKLCYHNLTHTLDVHQAVVRLSHLENIPHHIGVLLETAAFYHDSGMLVRYADHENYSITIVNEKLPLFGYNKEEIEEVSNLIRVTSLPQKALEQAEKIICDADLDCLGRDDFLVQSFNLRLEWKNFNIRQTSLSEWFSFELQFLEQHSYYTASAMALRNDQKMRNLKEIKDLLYKS